ncbi:MAG TPA: hypothetical protein VJ044_15220, partial [Candidatus Hodarchaeales archaeon]|nr:hypothetical protein [Candidatus Hodarchaeales archaeon]
MKKLACVIFLGLLSMTTFAFAQSARLGSWGVVCISPDYRDQFNKAARNDPRGIEYLLNSGACVHLRQESEVSIIGKV